MSTHARGATPAASPQADARRAPAPTRTAEQALDRLAERLHGRVVRPGDPDYDEARRVWNGMIDRHPAALAYCADPEDVAAAVQVAREEDLLLSVRGGGHNVAGTAVNDGGLVVDVSLMRDVTVDAATGRVRAGAGAVWADVDRATQPHGLAVAGGVVSTTGIAGLTLGGGMSSQRRRDGLTVDNLLAVELVTADGRHLRADSHQHADLFWALRGGGGNFGVVTAFEYRARPLGPEVAHVQLMYPMAQAHQVLARWRDIVADAPDEITSEAGVWAFPAVPEIPEEMHGVSFALVDAVYAGPVEEGTEALEPLRHLGEPLVDQSGPLPYLELQQSLDPFVPAGLRYYWKAAQVPRLTDDVLDLLVSRAADRPSPRTLVIVRHLGGAVARVPAEATAFGDRSAEFNVSIDASWETAADDETNIAWTRAFWRDLQPFSTGQTYFNFPGLLEAEDHSVAGTYGANYARLVDVKTTYDPGNLFRLNQNIVPRQPDRRGTVPSPR